MLEVYRIREGEDDSALCLWCTDAGSHISHTLVKGCEAMLGIEPVVDLTLPVFLS